MNDLENRVAIIFCFGQNIVGYKPQKVPIAPFAAELVAIMSHFFEEKRIFLSKPNKPE